MFFKLLFYFLLIIAIIFIGIYIYYKFKYGENQKHRLSGKEIENLSFDDALVVDVRTRKEYNNGHSKNAINLPFGVIKEGSKILDDYRDKKIIFYCTLDIMSSKAKDYYEKKGYKKLEIADGYMQYSYEKSFYQNILINDFKAKTLNDKYVLLNVGKEAQLKKEIHIYFENLEECISKLEKLKNHAIFLTFSNNAEESKNISIFLSEQGYKVENLIEDFSLEKFKVPFNKKEQELLYSQKIEEEFCPK